METAKSKSVDYGQAKHAAVKRVAVGLSGGIDSAVAAWLLLQQGVEVVGLTMSIWDGRHPLTTATQSACYGPGEVEDIAAARDIARCLGIEHHVVELAEQYERWVLDEFRAQYLDGQTPNPCAICNPTMKFGFLPLEARRRGIVFDRFATGHYVRVERDIGSGRWRLYRGCDATKDQSYFLARLTQQQLGDTIFPLGEMTKQEVRGLAAQAGWQNLTEKAESQDFFEGDDIGVLFAGAEVKPGPIVDESGKVLGEHRGIIHYTIGQRDGLGLALGYKVYVKAIDAAANKLIVAPRTGVFADGCRVRAVSWIAGEPPAAAVALAVRLRYRHAGVAAQAQPVDTTTLDLVFAEPQFAVTPGQMAVFYAGDEVLGGGWIAAKGASQNT